MFVPATMLIAGVVRIEKRVYIETVTYGPVYCKSAVKLIAAILLLRLLVQKTAWVVGSYVYQTTEAAKVSLTLLITPPGHHTGR